ncbi:STAS domain-containing protein [Actinoplanes awajinensis]|uniref:STAS domain-containing protein n=1 Tax=Actinoplanes awajinensis subsp. mycoplanecinus TaxID=135947 RepID=A0A101JBX8_9ACTN|nr:STAS domain-containing protein [Actinoplanes awajinensis]KUL23940.1 hypothetical protein ADL15_44815 [Actinoplanes awajinensis subsp. mycoplanecinus]
MILREDTDRTTVELTGELDRFNAPRLAELFGALADRRVRHVDVDMARVSFIDVGGLRTLAQAFHLAARRGATLALRRPSPQIVWLMRATDTTALLLGDAPPADGAAWSPPRTSSAPS